MAYDRQARVEIGKSASLIALRIEGLRVTFEVQKDLKTFANRAKIAIYNLSPATRGQIRELTDTVTLSAGYADETMSEVFHGDIVTVSHVREGAEIVTRIVANDGGTAIRQSFANVSHAEGASLKGVLVDLVGSMGLPVKFMDTFEDQKFLQGFAFAGRSRTGLDKVTARAGLEWSVQGGQLKILKRGGTDNPRNIGVPVISPEHGMIGSPERLDRLTDDPSAEKKPPGWKLTSLLQPQVEPGGKVGFSSAEEPTAKAYRVQVVNHNGDTHGDAWTSTFEVLEPGELLNTVSLDLAPGEKIA